jgi:energy-coupling factor transporter ATP-binding protein EcfA2
MSDELIRVQDLSFTYPDGTRALESVSFTIACGEKVALAGPNGAGKSTLLLLLCGVLHEHWEGSVEVCGLSLRKGDLRSIRRRLGLVFQNPDDQLFCPTVFDDVAFGPRNMRLSAEEVAGRVQAALSAVGLAGFERRSPFHLSLGEKRRAAIATVLSMRPEILVLDEPTSMLDPRSRRELIALLKGLGGTQITVAHDLGMIADVCDRVIVLSRGKVVADGDPASVLGKASFLEAHGLA